MKEIVERIPISIGGIIPGITAMGNYLMIILITAGNYVDLLQSF